MSLAYARERARDLRLTFGPFTVDAAHRTVSKNGEPLRLTLKCVELLIALLTHPGRTLTKEELLQAAWHDPSASDATLAQHVFLLRRSLEPHGDWIETVPQVGYRFSGDVRVERESEDATVEEYMRGAVTFRSLMTEQGLRSAIDLYSRVIDASANDGHAYAGRAACNRLLAQFMYADPLTTLSAASRDAALAFECAPEDIEVLIECAYSAALFDRDPRSAQTFLRRAQMLNAEHPEVQTLAASLALMRGDIAEALRPLAGKPGPLHGALLYLAREYAQARSELAMRLSDPLVRTLYSACQLFEGDTAAARETFAAIYHEAVDVRQTAHPNARHYALAFLIYAEARSGDEAAARRAALDLARLGRERYVSPMARAIAHTGLREFDSAISLVEEAVTRMDPWTAHICVDPFLDDLRGDERFERLVKIVAGLP
jgi:DNA-binding winged helix-turn-helix (wHTH) protein